MRRARQRRLVLEGNSSPAVTDCSHCSHCARSHCQVANVPGSMMQSVLKKYRLHHYACVAIGIRDEVLQSHAAHPIWHLSGLLHECVLR